MKINRIFGGIWSVTLDGQKKDEFSRAFTNWQDVEYLEAFFEDNLSDLMHGYYRFGSVEEAVWATLQEARAMESRLLTLCQNARLGIKPGLEALFVPLNNHEFRERRLGRRKAKGPARRSWLRIYAIKIDEDCYVVAGSAIKLSHRMEERVHTRLQLKQIDRVRAYLVQEGIEDFDGFLELQL